MVIRSNQRLQSFSDQINIEINAKLKVKENKSLDVIMLLAFCIIIEPNSQKSFSLLFWYTNMVTMTSGASQELQELRLIALAGTGNNSAPLINSFTLFVYLLQFCLYVRPRPPWHTEKGGCKYRV